MFMSFIGLDADETILACRFEPILALLDGYPIWLISSRQADNLVGRMALLTRHIPRIRTESHHISQAALPCSISISYPFGPRPLSCLR